jgi:hypothetical protein
MKPLRVGALAAAALAIAVILALQLHPVRALLSAAARRYIERKVSALGEIDLALHALEIDPLSRVTLRGVRVAARVPYLAPRPLLEADSVAFRYSVLDLVKGRRIERLRVAGARVHADALGERTRAGAGGGAARGARALPALGVDTLSIGGAEIAGLAGRAIRAIDVEASVEIGGAAARIDVRRASALVDSARIALSGRAALAGDSLALDDVRIALGESHARVRGGVALATPIRVDLAVDADTLFLADVAPLAPSAPRDGAVAGRLMLRGDPGCLRAEGRLAATFAGRSIDAELVRVTLTPVAVEIDSLRAQLGEARYAASWRLPWRGGAAHSGALHFEHVNLRTFASDSTHLPQTDLSGVVAWGGVGWEPRRLDGDVRVDLTAGAVGDVAFERAAAEGRIAGGLLTARTLEARLLGGIVTGSGEISLSGEFDLLARARFEDLSRVASRLRLSGASGRGAFEGRIVRSGGRLVFDGTLIGETWAANGFRFDEVEASGSLVSVGDSTTVVATGRIGEIAGYGKRLGGLEASVRYEAGHFFLEEFSGQVGGTAFEARGEWMREGDSDRFLVTSLAITRSGERTEYPREIEVRREGERFTLLPVSIALRGGRILASAAYAASGALDAEVAWTGVRLSDLPIPAPLDGRLFDRTSGSLRVSGPTGAPEVRLDVSGRADSPDTSGFAGIDVSLEAKARSRVRARIAFADGDGRDRLVFAGTLADSLPAAALGRRGSVGETLRALLRPDITATADSLRIAWLRPLAKELAGFDGPLTGSLRFRGDPVSLDVDGSVRVSPLRYRGAEIAGLDGEVRLGGGRLALDIRFEPSWGRSSLLVELPVRLDATAPSLAFDPAGALELAVDVERGDLGVLPLVIGQVREASGDFTLHMEGTGTLASPNISGAMHATNGALLIRDLAELYEDVTADVVMQGDRITITGLTARVGETGRVEANGSLRLVAMKGDDFDFAVRLRAFEIESIPGAGARLDADLLVRTQPTALFSRVPHVTGRIDILGGVVDQNFEKAVPGAPPPAIFRENARPDFTCEIEVRAPRDVWVANSDMEIELRGEGTLTRSTRGLGFVGTAESIRGRYFLYRSWIANELRVEQGEISWTNPDDATRLRIDALATTEIGGDKIEVTARGTLDSLQIAATSESELPESEILAQLGLSAVGGAGSTAAVQSWAGVGATLLARELLQGYGSVEFHTVAGTQQVTVGRYLRPNLYFDYTQSIGGPREETDAASAETEALTLPDRQFRVDYNVSRDLFLEALTGSFRDGSRYLNLDLKVRLGY